MVELMIVLTIIVALMALTASAVLKYVGSQQEYNTQSTLDRTQSQLGRAWSKVKDQAYTEPIPISVASWIQNNLGGTDANATGRVRVIYVKLKLRQAFPMNFDEALNLATPNTGNLQSPLGALPAYKTYLFSLGITGSTALTTNIESSACLLMALQRGVSGAGINPSDLMTGGAAGNYPIPNSSNNIPYLTDAWGRPIFFTRVPAGCINLNPATAQSVANNPPVPWGTVTCYSQPGANDPGDPQGFLQTPSWGTSFGTNFTALTLQVLAKGNSSYKLAPMLASGGQNNWLKTGTTPPFDPITFYSPPSSGVLYSNP
jgi:hypothetical protein